MTSIEVSAKAINLKAISKRIQQISWSLSKLEQMYVIEEIKSEKDLNSMVTAYTELIGKYNQACDELNKLTISNGTNE